MTTTMTPRTMTPRTMTPRTMTPRTTTPRTMTLARHAEPDLDDAFDPDATQAMGELYRRLASRARRAACSYCRPDDVDDAVADGFVRALTSLRQLRDPRSVEAWVMRCVIHAAVDISRRGRRQFPDSTVVELIDRSGPPAESAADRVLHAIDHDDVAAALRALPNRTRTLLELRYGVPLSIREIAALLDEPEGSVRRRCVDARRLARRHYLRSQ